MAIERQEFLQVLRDSFTAYYNIIPPEEAGAPDGVPLVFRADYFSRAESYWLVKSITLWGNETNEYAYIFSAPEFDAELVNRCIDFAIEDMLPRVKPHREHQYTNVKTVFVADNFGEDARGAVQKRSFTKNYKFSFYGFTTLHSAAVDLSESRAYTNKAGYALADYFRKLFASRGEKPEGKSL